MIEMLNEDCMEVMARYQDDHFDLAIVDPPFGIGSNWNKDTSSQFYKHKSTYKNKEIPKEDYFIELFRVSKNQIIWGANYYWKYLKPTSNIIWWDKLVRPEKHLRSAGELAWTSITRWPANQFTFAWNGCVTGEPRSGIHPHEKPISLYRWLLENYAEKGQLVLDTHGGSFSSAIAAHYFGCDMVICEKDEEYFAAATERFDRDTRQLSMFD